MMESNERKGHTPGGWATGLRSNMKAVAGPCGEWICVFPNGRREGYGLVCDAEIAANTRLIAAAPNLLTHLKFAVALLGPLCGGTAQVEAMRAAITKAEAGS